MIRDIPHNELSFVFAAQRDWVRATQPVCGSSESPGWPAGIICTDIAGDVANIIFEDTVP